MPRITIIIRPKRIKKYFKRNPGSLFVIGFGFSLFASSGLLITGDSVFADGAAIVAYFLLVFGVFLQLVAYIMHEREDSS